MHFAKLTERELDSANAQKLLPGGCDQQGREPTGEWVPMDFRPGWCIQAAEAATELGQKEDERWTQSQLDYLRVIVWVVSPLLVVGLLALAALCMN